MMLDIINEFRQMHGAGRVGHLDNVVSDYCVEHSRAMAQRGYLYHAEQGYRNGWAECVAVHSKMYDWNDMERRVVFDCFGGSIMHKRILLSGSMIAYGTYVSGHEVYFTLRVK